MDLEKIYNKLERMDSRIDKYMLETENRLTKVETNLTSVSGTIKATIMAVVGIVTSIVTYVIKLVFSSQN